MMLPIVLDLARLGVALVGRDARAVRRLALIEADGVRRVRVFSDRPSPALAEAAGPRLLARLPAAADLAGTAVVYIADLGPDEGAALARIAKAAGALVNVEDDRAASDFHSPSVLRRGELAIAISTNGKSPALARRIREFLETLFPADWAGRLARLADLRRRLRECGASAPVIVNASRGYMEREAWLAAPGADGTQAARRQRVAPRGVHGPRRRRRAPPLPRQRGSRPAALP
ncbi:MAG: precorrin-2 dehydrogenase/sirohydrochlorin ferrochelatase family protein [Pseudomonadota bacterium]